MSLYSVRMHQDGYLVSKFDEDLNVKGYYYLVPTSPQSKTKMNCSCPASLRDTCRHREMLRMFIRKDEIGTGRMYDYDEATWEEVA